MANACKVCGKQDVKRCGKCRIVFYCSVQCQRKDWKSHKEACNSKIPKQPSAPQNNSSDEKLGKAIFSQPFTLEKFIPHVKEIKDDTKRCAAGWVDLRLAGLMDVDSSLATCFVFYTSEAFVRSHMHMVCMEAPPQHTHLLQQIVDRYKAHAISMSAEIRYRNPHTMSVLKEGVLLQVCAKGCDEKFFFDQTGGGRSHTGVLLSSSDPEECHISLFDGARLEFH